jgi:hypothetical protein
VGRNQLVQDSVQWQAFASTVMNYPGPQKQGNVFTGCETTNFSETLDQDSS